MTADHLKRVEVSIQSRLLAGKVRASALHVLLSQCLIIVKMKQDFITTFPTDDMTQHSARQWAISLLAKAYKDHDGALKLLDSLMMALLSEKEYARDERNREQLAALLPLLSAYREDRVRLGKRVDQATAALSEAR